MRRVPGLLLGAAGVAALLAACGSSSTSSTSSPASSSGAASSSSTAPGGGATTVDSTYAQAAGAICTTAETQIAQTPIPGDPTKATAADMPKWATYLANVAQIHAQALQQIAALPPPTSGAAAAQAAGALAVKLQTDLQNGQTAAQNGDLNGFATAVAQFTQDTANVNTAFDALGIKACGSGSSAATATTS